LTVAANAELLTSIAELPDWIELLAPAPVGVAIVSQLLICASRLKSDFAFVQHSDDKERFNLIKDPDSFRTTLWQIAKESYEAFAKAHNNMENFLLQMGQVPGYAKDCVMYVRSVDRAKLKTLFGRRLAKIKEAADDGARLTKQVCEAFDLLEQLINQVIESSSLTMSQIEKEIVNDQVTKMEAKEKEKRLAELQQELKTSKDIRCWTGTSYGVYENAFEHDRSIKKEEQMQQEIDQISDDSIQHLDAMRVDTDKTLEQNEMLRTLKESLNNLGQLLDKWSSIHRFFNTIRNHYMEVTFPRLKDFSTDAQEAEEMPYNYVLIGELEKSLEKSLESCYETHHSAAKLYVRVSDKHIMKSINLMHSMLSIPLSEVEGAQIKLMASCEEATKGVKNMYNEERAESTRGIEKKNSSTGK
jgi:uncharacterized ubiquitin-like protein YukD